MQCTIEQIADWHPHLFLEPHIVACVAVLSQYSDSPAQLDVECIKISSDWLGDQTSFRLELSWSDQVAQKAERLRLTMQSGPLVELAAIAISSILTKQVVDLGQLDVTKIGERADYRSLDIPSVLEISGTTSISEMTRRHRYKVEQALDNPFGLDAYVVICGFFRDRHKIRFSFHQWAEVAKEK